MTVTIDHEQLNELIEVLGDHGLDIGDPEEVQVRHDYSGRGMYGRTCLGFTTPNPLTFMVRLGYALATLGGEWTEEVTEDLLENVCQDNMGRDYIVYFPGIQVVAD
jgi:hypothetical protein